MQKISSNVVTQRFIRTTVNVLKQIGTLIYIGRWITLHICIAYVGTRLRDSRSE